MSQANLSEVRVIAFPGAPNLPTFASVENGFFAEEGLTVSVETTPNSVYQFEKFAAGAFDIAFTAFDNVVAYSEGQGAVALAEDPGFKVIMGATQLELAFVVQPDIRSYPDLKGRTIALDALSTGFAFVLYDMLAKGGLSDGDFEFAAVGATPQRWQSVKAGEHVGTLTIEPFTSIARKSGFTVLDTSTALYEAYQGGVVAVRQSWSRTNAETVKAFIRGYLKGLDWTRDPANRMAAETLLVDKMPQIQPAAAKPVMESLLSPRSGLTPGGAVLREGMAKVLDLRSRYGSNRPLFDIEKYLDLSFHHAVVGAA